VQVSSSGCSTSRHPPPRRPSTAASRCRPSRKRASSQPTARSPRRGLGPPRVSNPPLPALAQRHPSFDGRVCAACRVGPTLPLGPSGLPVTGTKQAGFPFPVDSSPSHQHHVPPFRSRSCRGSELPGDNSPRGSRHNHKNDAVRLRVSPLIVRFRIVQLRVQGLAPSCRRMESSGRR
jgi:hypothetical protein